MKIVIVDGQGGKLGKLLVEQLKKLCPDQPLYAIGTNSAATATMLRAGADFGATGENSVVRTVMDADAVLGPMGIVASKILYTVLSALVVTALFGGAVYYDYSKLFSRLDLDKETLQQLQFAFTMMSGTMGGNVSLTKVILTLAFETGTVLIQIILTMCTAYLAITLSATLLQNKKGFLRLLVSFLLFAVLNYATTKVGGMVSHDVVPNTTEELLRMLGAQAAVDLAFAVVFAGATAWLLDRKVSL